jgi:hypothetical protein
MAARRAGQSYALDELQQRILRESLRQAVSVQERLKREFCP